MRFNQNLFFILISTTTCRFPFPLLCQVWTPDPGRSDHLPGARVWVAPGAPAPAPAPRLPWCVSPCPTPTVRASANRPPRVRRRTADFARRCALEPTQGPDRINRPRSVLASTTDRGNDPELSSPPLHGQRNSPLVYKGNFFKRYSPRSQSPLPKTPPPATAVHRDRDGEGGEGRGGRGEGGRWRHPERKPRQSRPTRGDGGRRSFSENDNREDT